MVDIKYFSSIRIHQLLYTNSYTIPNQILLTNLHQHHCGNDKQWCLQAHGVWQHDLLASPWEKYLSHSPTTLQVNYHHGDPLPNCSSVTLDQGVLSLNQLPLQLSDAGDPSCFCPSTPGESYQNTATCDVHLCHGARGSCSWIIVHWAVDLILLIDRMSWQLSGWIKCIYWDEVQFIGFSGAIR